MPTDFAKTAGSNYSWYSSEVAFAKFLVLLNFLAENPQKQHHLFLVPREMFGPKDALLDAVAQDNVL